MPPVDPPPVAPDPPLRCALVGAGLAVAVAQVVTVLVAFCVALSQMDQAYERGRVPWVVGWWVALALASGMLVASARRIARHRVDPAAAFFVVWNVAWALLGFSMLHNVAADRAEERAHPREYRAAHPRQ